MSATFDYGSKVADMFQQSGCANKNPPTEMAGPWCAATCPGMAPTTASPSASPITLMPTTLTPSKSPSTGSPSKSPMTFSPAGTDTPTAISEYFFPDRATLKAAVDSYISENCATNPTCATITQYGEIEKWHVSKVYDFSELFKDKSSFNQDISKWDVSAGNNFAGMFYSAGSFNQNISNWNIGSVLKNMRGMFTFAVSFNQDISNWNVHQVSDMGLMFYGASSFNQNLCPWGGKVPASIYNTHVNLMFFNSGCHNKQSPTGSSGPWCNCP